VIELIPYWPVISLEDRTETSSKLPTLRNASMRRQLLALFALAAMLACVPLNSASAVGGGHGHGGNGGRGGHGIGGRGFGGRGIGGGIIGFGGGDFGYGGWDVAELYRELYHNLPYFALHPPVYYSEPVPRTYGYSPFAYPPGVMTPEVTCAPQPVHINNPYVPSSTPAASPAGTTSDRSAATTSVVEPLVVINPYVTQSGSVAQSER